MALATRTHSSHSLSKSNILTPLTVLDGYNMFIPAAQISAARIGLAATPQEAADCRIIDFGLRLNFRGLHDLVFGQVMSSRAILVSSHGVEQNLAPVYAAARRCGWGDTRIFQRSAFGREKRVDATISLALVEETILKGLNPLTTEITLLASDNDFLPAVEILQRYGFAVDVMGWHHATSRELQRAARKFIALDPFFEQLTFRKSSTHH